MGKVRVYNKQYFTRIIAFLFITMFMISSGLLNVNGRSFAKTNDKIKKISFDFPSGKSKTIKTSEGVWEPNLKLWIYNYEQYLVGGVLTVEYTSGKKEKLTYGKWGDNGDKGMRNYGFLNDKGVDPFYTEDWQEYDMGSYIASDGYTYYIDKNQTKQWEPGKHYFTIRFYENDISVDVPVTLVDDNPNRVKSLSFEFGTDNDKYLLKNTGTYHNGMYDTDIYMWDYNDRFIGGRLTVKMADGSTKKYIYKSVKKTTADNMEYWDKGFYDDSNKKIPYEVYFESNQEGGWDDNGEWYDANQWTTKSTDCHFTIKVDGAACEVPVKIVDSKDEAEIILEKQSDGDLYAVKKTKFGNMRILFFSGFARSGNDWWYVESGREGRVYYDAYGPYKGTVNGKTGYWNCVHGKVDFGFTGFMSYENTGWWYTEKGYIDTNKTCIAYGNVDGVDGWWFVKNGKVSFTNSIAQNSNGWWYVKKGMVDFTYNGLASNANGWWVIKKGKVDFGFTGFAQNSNGWWYCEKGNVKFQKSGFAYGKVNDQDGWWYVEKGKVVLTKNGTIEGTVNGKKSKWSVKNGRVILEDNYKEETTYKKPEVKEKNVVKTSNNNSNGWYYTKNGKVDTSYNGFASNDGGWWYVEKGKVSFKKNGIIKGTLNGTSGWWYVKNSKVQFVDTIAKNESGWWRIRNGRVNFSYTGLAKYNGCWWYIKKGQLAFNYTGLCKYSGTWWYVKGGKVDFGYTGLCKYSGSWWYVKGGKVNFGYTGLCKYSGSWWYVKGGIVNFDYTGLSKYSGSWWYVKKGKLDAGYTGNVKHNGKIYKVKNGKVIN